MAVFYETTTRKLNAAKVGKVTKPKLKALATRFVSTGNKPGIKTK
jgi:hypothetical protein